MSATKFKNSNGYNNFDFSHIQARVDRVNIGGLIRTHDDYVRRSIENVFTAKTFPELLIQAQIAGDNVNELGIFKNYRIRLDTSKGKNATENGYELTFDGVELRRINGEVSTELNQNEGVVKVNVTSPNLFGRGESISFNGSYSHLHTTDVNLTFTKPFLHTKIGKFKPITSFSVFRHSGAFSWSKYKTQNIGLLFDLSYRFPQQIKHNLQYEFAVKEISTLGKHVPLSVRTHCGPHLVSLIRYMVSYDARDSNVYPTKGIYVRSTNELAGILGGNVGYAMSNTHYEMNVPLAFGISAQLCYRIGMIRQRDKNYGKIPINNLFTLGGPLSLRGFHVGGASNHEDGCAIGAHTYWTTGLHIWAPLPFNSYFSTFGNLFRTHLFYNFGNCDSFSTENMRSAAGIGLAFRMGQIARLEFNYCIPMHTQKGDNFKNGFQFGIGYEFI